MLFLLRPSDTENIVRIYAEAVKEADAKQLADAVRKVVEELAK